MTVALLLALVGAADLQPAFLGDGAPRAVRLVADEVAAEQQPGYSGWTEQQLKLEQKRIDAEKPGLGLPITLMAVGGGVLLQALYILLSVATSSGLQNDIPMAVIAAVGSTAGAAIGIIGGIVLWGRLPERRAASARLDEVERELERREREEEEGYGEVPEQPIIGPPPEGPPPLPLPPMPSSGISIHVPILFARF